MKTCQRWTLGLLLTVLVCTMRASGQDDDLDVEDIEDTDTVEQPSPEEIKVEKVVYVQPKVKGNSFLAETFESQSELKKRWVLSEAKKDDIDENIAKYDGVWQIEEAVDSTLEGDLGLVLKSRAKHHAVSTKLTKTFEFSGKPFVMQYEVKFQNGQDCGGAYVKLLTADPKLNLKRMTDKTPYTIMFGPDKCGNDNKLHFIFRHQNPVNGKFEEKHANKPSASLDSYFTDKKTHLYTLVIRPDNSFEVYVDQTLINSGNLLEDVNPPVNPPKEITDPDDRKPEDWDEREKIPDPEAIKPEDWDESEPEMITDPAATKPEGWLDDEPELIPDPDSDMPEDWEEDMDGEWEPPMLQNPTCEAAPGCGEWVAPQIKNPLYKGKWRAAMIDNPNYKGKWKARKIANPDFFEDSNPYKMTPIGAIGLELWSMSDDILFDNFIVTDSKAVADDWAEDSWAIKVKQEKKAGKASGRSVVDAVMDATEERPWLWAVFIIVVLLPIVLVIAYCCMPSSSPKPDEVRARAKKTDEPTPDVYKEDDDESDEKEEEIEEEEEAEKKTSKPKKEAPSAMSGAGDAAPAKGKAKKSDLEAEEQEEEEEESAEADNEEDDGASKGMRSSPRKRKTRARKD